MTDPTQAAYDALSRARDTDDPRTPDLDVQEGHVLALLAIADAIRGLTPNAAQEATGGDLAASQAEPGLHLAEADWQEYYDTTDTMVLLKARAENAEAERDAILSDLRHLEAQWENQPNVLQRGAFIRAATQLGSIIDRYTPEG